MADVRRVGDNAYVLEGGAYRGVTAAEAEALEGDFRQVAIKSALADLRTLGGTVGAALAPRGGAGFKGQAISNFATPTEQQTAINTVRPEAGEAGGALIDIAGAILGGGLATRGGRQATGPMAERVAARIAAQAEPDDLAGAATFGATSAGAAQAQPVSGFGRLFRLVTDQLDNPKSMSADQFEILDARLWDDVGFEFPPGSLQSEQLYASMLSNPFTRAAIEPTLVANSQRLGQRFISAVGLDPADFPRGFGRGVRSASKQRFRGIFNGLADSIDGADLSDIAGDLSPFVSRQTRDLLQEGGGEVDGRTLFAIRSKVRKAQERAWNNPDPGQVQLLDDLSETLDNVIGEQLPDEALATWARTREQYRTFKVLDRPGVISPDTGDISLKSLALRLNDQYDDFADLSPADLSQAQFLNAETGELLKFARVARSFADSISDSGTATRSTLQALASNPKAGAKMTILRHALEAGSRGPDETLELVR